MRTHHRRFGGRTGELILLFALIAFSAALLGAEFWFWTAAQTWLSHQGGPYLLAAAGGVMFVASLWVLRRLWSAFLRYYRYEAHTLRPLDDRENNE